MRGNLDSGLQSLSSPLSIFGTTGQMLSWALLVGCATAASVFALSPPLSIRLETGWPAPPLLLEIL